MVGIIIQGLIALNVADYEWKNWHGTLLTIAVVAFSIIFNTLLATRLPLIEGTVLILHLAGFFAIIIPLWVMAPRAHPHILLEFSNNGGWSTTGVSAMIGLTTPLSVLIGYDCSAHMCKGYSFSPFRITHSNLSLMQDGDPYSGGDSRRLAHSPEGINVVCST
jgi:choline transport protein